MSRHYLQLLWVIAIILPLFTSCKDDKEDEAPSRKELLTAHAWKGDQLLIMGINVSQSGLSSGSIPDIRKILLTFNRDNTYVAKSDNVVIFSGDWRLDGDETKIYFDFLGFGEFDIKALTDDSLVLTKSVSKAQLTLLAQVLNIDLGIINSFPDGTEFETEIMFVKP